MLRTEISHALVCKVGGELPVWHEAPGEQSRPAFPQAASAYSTTFGQPQPCHLPCGLTPMCQAAASLGTFEVLLPHPRWTHWPERWAARPSICTCQPCSPDASHSPCPVPHAPPSPGDPRRCSCRSRSSSSRQASCSATVGRSLPRLRSASNRGCRPGGGSGRRGWRAASGHVCACVPRYPWACRPAHMCQEQTQLLLPAALTAYEWAQECVYVHAQGDLFKRFPALRVWNNSMLEPAQDALAGGSASVPNAG